MKSFNVMGDCVSRDILEFGGVKVSQYHAFSSPFSICSGKSEKIMLLDDLKNVNGKEYSNFVKRCIISDFNKSVLDYVFAKKSDYFVLDILDARHPLLVIGNHCITMTKRFGKIRHLIPEYFEINKYEERLPYSGDSMKQWKDCMAKIAGEIRRHYVENRIILNVHYGVRQYISGTEIKNFPVNMIGNIEQYNMLVRNLFQMLRVELEGCHVIEFPDYVIADANHKWGLAELHYHDLYYNYGKEAIQVILRDLPEEEEKAELERLRVNCSERFELLRTKKELEAMQRSLVWFRNALNFAEAHASDHYGDEKFSKWLKDCKTENKKVVVLNRGCAAGRILMKGLVKYGVNVTFSTGEAGFGRLKEEQFALCKEADIVVSANIHSNALPEREGVRAVSVYDILRQ